MKLFFLVRSLDVGGAERQLVLLANELARRGHQVTIATYYSGGALEKEVDTSRVHVIPLGKRSRWNLISFYRTLLRVIRQERPDIVHGWMSGANLVSIMVRLLHPKVPIFWCIRCSNIEMILDVGGVENAIGWLERRLSHFASCIVVNSRAGLNHTVSRGFPPRKLVHIPNGIDGDSFSPDAAAGERARFEWGFTGSERLIGLVGRLDPIKDHAAFLRAAAQLAQEMPEVCFVCLGDGPAHYREKLQALSRDLGLEQRVVWIPSCRDMKAAYNALEVVCLPSLSEGFPNVIAEAMACGRHCVVTDVGDSSFLMGDTGVVVAPGDPKALAQALRQTLTLERNVNQWGRQRILEHFTVTHLADRTEKLLLGFCSEHREANRGCVTQGATDYVSVQSNLAKWKRR